MSAAMVAALNVFTLQSVEIQGLTIGPATSLFSAAITANETQRSIKVYILENILCFLL
jgi:hypothetical protein